MRFGQEMGCSIKKSSYLLTKKSWHKLLTTKCFLSHVLYLREVFFVCIAFCVRCTLCKGFLVQDDFCVKGFLWQLSLWANDIFLAKRFCFLYKLSFFLKAFFCATWTSYLSKSIFVKRDFCGSCFMGKRLIFGKKLLCQLFFFTNSFFY